MELTQDWRKSSYSGGSGSANCVEAGSAPGGVMVRDTKNEGRGPVLSVSADDWHRLTTGVKAGTLALAARSPRSAAGKQRGHPPETAGCPSLLLPPATRAGCARRPPRCGRHGPWRALP